MTLAADMINEIAAPLLHFAEHIPRMFLDYFTVEGLMHVFRKAHPVLELLLPYWGKALAVLILLASLAVTNIYWKNGSRLASFILALVMFSPASRFVSISTNDSAVPRDATLQSLLNEKSAPEGLTSTYEKAPRSTEQLTASADGNQSAADEATASRDISLKSPRDQQTSPEGLTSTYETPASSVEQLAAVTDGNQPAADFTQIPTPRSRPKQANSRNSQARSVSREEQVTFDQFGSAFANEPFGSAFAKDSFGSAYPRGAGRNAKSHTYNTNGYGSSYAITSTNATSVDLSPSYAGYITNGSINANNPLINGGLVNTVNLSNGGLQNNGGYLSNPGNLGGAAINRPGAITSVLSHSISSH
ncbi:hypothetical protein [Rhodopseudomonas sp. RCAM05734]|uniref:hypothetical protein n=1 Tax=Rhodopseudomonas sp. RCAM05734 TaxID=3457549 RepID=UPI004044B180